jgi:hypothetical protein
LLKLFFTFFTLPPQQPKSWPVFSPLGRCTPPLYLIPAALSIPLDFWVVHGVELDRIAVLCGWCVVISCVDVMVIMVNSVLVHQTPQTVIFPLHSARLRVGASFGNLREFPIFYSFDIGPSKRGLTAQSADNISRGSTTTTSIEVYRSQS